MNRSRFVGTSEHVGTLRSPPEMKDSQVKKNVCLTCGFFSERRSVGSTFRRSDTFRQPPSSDNETPGDWGWTPPDTTPPARPGAGYSPRRKGWGTHPSPRRSEPVEVCLSGCVRVMDFWGDRP